MDNQTENTLSDMTTAWRLCILAYILAFAFAVLTGFLCKGSHPVWIAFAADIAATLVIYAFSCTFKNASFYDPYWSVAPVPIAFFFAIWPVAPDTVLLRKIIVILLVMIWAVRLTGNWVRQWKGLSHEDWRYADLRKKSGRLFFLVDLGGIEMMPTILVFAGCLSLFAALSAGSKPFGFMDGIAMIVTAGAIYIEATADRQLREFAEAKKEPGDIMKTGLWAYSRHPNYFGEITFWWGLYLFGLAAAPKLWWTIVGPLGITALFVFVSVPMIEKRSMERRPEYGEHIKNVSAIVPWFPRGNKIL